MPISKADLETLGFKLGVSRANDFGCRLEVRDHSDGPAWWYGGFSVSRIPPPENAGRLAVLIALLGIPVGESDEGRK